MWVGSFLPCEGMAVDSSVRRDRRPKSIHYFSAQLCTHVEQRRGDSSGAIANLRDLNDLAVSPARAPTRRREANT
jgi:hypothetical protein